MKLVAKMPKAIHAQESKRHPEKKPKRLNREFSRRTRVAGCFPYDESARALIGTEVRKRYSAASGSMEEVSGRYVLRSGMAGDS